MNKTLFLIAVLLFILTGVFAAIKIPKWKTYRQAEYGFEFQYPANWFSNPNLKNSIKNTPNSTLIFELSPNPDFEAQEFAMVLDGYIANNLPAKGADALNLEEMKNRLKVDVQSNFFGNPPWGNYEMIIPLKSKRNVFLKFIARIHGRDEWEKNGVDLKIFNKILSSFRFR